MFTSKFKLSAMMMTLIFAMFLSSITTSNDFFEDYVQIDEDESEDRAIILTTGENVEDILGSLNTTTVDFTPILLIAAAIAFPFIGISLIVFIVIAVAVFAKKATGSNFIYDNGIMDDYSSYSGYGRSHGSLNSDWEFSSILEMLSKGTELIENYEVNNPDCYMRVVCEVYENYDTFGSVAKKMDDVLWYARKLRSYALPESVSNMLGGITKASKIGSSKNKECRKAYKGCSFSLKTLTKR